MSKATVDQVRSWLADGTYPPSMVMNTLITEYDAVTTSRDAAIRDLFVAYADNAALRTAIDQHAPGYDVSDLVAVLGQPHPGAPLLAVVEAALRLNECAREFDGDLDPCSEHLDALWRVCDALRRREGP